MNYHQLIAFVSMITLSSIGYVSGEEILKEQEISQEDLSGENSDLNSLLAAWSPYTYVLNDQTVTVLLPSTPSVNTKDNFIIEGDKFNVAVCQEQESTFVFGASTIPSYFKTNEALIKNLHEITTRREIKNRESLNNHSQIYEEDGIQILDSTYVRSKQKRYLRVRFIAVNDNLFMLLANIPLNDQSEELAQSFMDSFSLAISCQE